MKLSKTCKTCGIEKEIESFNKRIDSKDRLQYSCRDCEKDRQSEIYRQRQAKYGGKFKGREIQKGRAMMLQIKYGTDVAECLTSCIDDGIDALKELNGY